MELQNTIAALVLEVKDLKQDFANIAWEKTIKEIEPLVTEKNKQLEKLELIIADKKKSAPQKFIELFKRQQQQIEGTLSHYKELIKKFPESLQEEVEEKRDVLLDRFQKVLLNAENQINNKYQEGQKQHDNQMLEIGEMFKEINNCKDTYDTVSTNITELNNTLEIFYETITKIQNNVKIFQLEAPVTVNIYEYMPFVETLPATSEELQTTLYKNWPDFVWKDTKVPETDVCKKKKHPLNIAQNISMHYFNPFTELKGVLLNHSAGAGKSATASLIASTFVRDDKNRVIVWVTKPGLDHIGVDGITTQADVNVQQYTNGEPLESKVHTDLVKEFQDNKPTLIQEDASNIAYECMSLLSKYVSPQRVQSDTERSITQTKSCYLCIEYCKKLLNSDKDYSKMTKIILKGAVAYVQHVIFPKIGIQWKTAYYNEFAKLGGSCESVDSNKNTGIPQKWINYFTKPVTPKRVNDILENMLIIVDEAHLLVSSEKSKDNITESKCFIQRFLNIAYKSETLSGSRACKWLLLTATPIIDHPLDLINLSLLINTKELAYEYGFHKYTDVGPIMQGNITTTNKAKTEAKFIKAYKNPNSNKFTDYAVEGFKKMLHGKFSVFNYAGDFSHFANPEVTYIPVDLQLLQIEQALTTCLPSTGKDIDETTANIVVEQSKGAFVYNNKNKTLSRDKSIGGVKGLKIVNKKTSPQCLQYTAISAEKINKRDFITQLSTEDTKTDTTEVTRDETTNKKHKGKKNPKPRKIKLPASEPISMTSLVNGDYTKLLENKENVKIFSPLMYTVLKQIGTDRIMTKEFLNEKYKSMGSLAPPVNKQMKFLKQTIHIDLKSFQDSWGTKLLEYLLSLPQFGGYKRINPRITNAKPPTMKPEDYIKDGLCDDYKGMIVMDGDIHNSNFDNYKKQAINYFNDTSNADGKKCLLLINTYRLREGISLYDVHVTHMIGYFTSRAYLIQAAYRGIRNCSNRNIPFTAKEGWKIKVRMYTPTLPNSDITGISLYEMMDETTQTKQLLINQMESLLVKNAYDAKLLKVINTHSNNILGRFQLYPKKTILNDVSHPENPETDESVYMDISD